MNDKKAVVVGVTQLLLTSVWLPFVYQWATILRRQQAQHTDIIARHAHYAKMGIETRRPEMLNDFSWLKLFLTEA